MATSNKIVTTPAGLERLDQRLTDLQQRVADLVASKAEVAETGGNQWHDNASFEELERNERVLRRQIADLKAQIARVVVVDGIPVSSDIVSIGTTVVIRFDSEAPREYEIRGHGESDPRGGVIACDAPLAQALLGARAGDLVTFTVGHRTRRVTVEAIR
jgi:transcription elongation GreA/GreB family factor